MSIKPKLPVPRAARPARPREPVADDEARPSTGQSARFERQTARIDLPISSAARADLETSKRMLALGNDRDLLRHALALQRWAVDVLRGGKRVFVTDAEGNVLAEMKVDPVAYPELQEVIDEETPDAEADR